MWIINKFDPVCESKRETIWKKTRIIWEIFLFFLCLSKAIMIRFLWKRPERMGELLFCIVAGSLLTACITDLQSLQVYRFVWWFGLAAVLFLLLEQRQGWILVEACFFCVLQQLLFSRFYGRADCHAFCICALTACALDHTMLFYLSQMAVAMVLLFAVQLYRKNIGRDGNLKHSVAFLPYITVSFWVSLLLF